MIGHLNRTFILSDRSCESAAAPLLINCSRCLLVIFLSCAATSQIAECIVGTALWE